MRTIPASIWLCVALLLGSDLQASQLREPNERAAEIAVLVACPRSRASGDESLLVIELPGAFPERATSGLLYRGSASPNMFATPTNAPESSACSQVGFVSVIARNVRARVLRDRCESDSTVVADDLVLLETSEPVVEQSGLDLFAVSDNGQAWSPVIARSDLYFLANASGRGSEKLLRSSLSGASRVVVEDESALAVGRTPAGDEVVIALADDQGMAAGVGAADDLVPRPTGQLQPALRKFTRLGVPRCQP